MILSGRAFADSGNLPGFGYFTTVVTVQFMGLTVAAYDGDQTDYEGANALCSAGYSSSHVCTVNEILSIINIGGAIIDTGEGWVNDGPPGYTADANDCKGWQSNALGVLGRYWDFSTMQGWMRGCVNSVKFACCK